MSEPVTITELSPRGMITIRADITASPVKAAIKKICDLPVPSARQITGDLDQGLAWMSPDELLFLCPHEAADQAVEDFTAALGAHHNLVVNVSDARALFRIAGGLAAREVIAKGAPVDMAPQVFAPGEIRRTRLGQVAAAFWVNGDGGIDMICFRSVADFVGAWLQTAARESSFAPYFTE